MTNSTVANNLPVDIKVTQNLPVISQTNLISSSSSLDQQLVGDHNTVKGNTNGGFIDNNINLVVGNPNSISGQDNSVFGI